MKQPRQLLLGLVSAALLSSILSASPLLQLGDNANLFFNGSAELRRDSNLALDETNRISDTVFQISPGLELVVGGAGEAPGRVTFLWREDIIRYSSESRFNTRQSNALARGTYVTPRFDGLAEFTFNERQSNTSSINIPGGLVESDMRVLRTRGEYEVTPKTRVSAAVQHVKTRYRKDVNGVIPDREFLAIPLNVYFVHSQKLDFTAGYRYRTTDIESLSPTAFGNDPDDHFFNVGLRGELTPKLTGRVIVGYQERRFTVGPAPNISGLSIDTRLLWEASPKTSVNTELFRDFTIGAGGGTILNTGARVNVQHALSPLWTFITRFGYEEQSYKQRPRKDDYISVGFAVNYQPNEHVRLGAGYTHTDNDSNNAGSSFTRNVFNLTASLRY